MRTTRTKERAKAEEKRAKQSTVSLSVFCVTCVYELYEVVVV